MIDLNRIYNEDCLTTLDKMDDGFLDLTVTSVPYNVDLGNNKFNKNPYDLYVDNKEHIEYISWLKNIFLKIFYKTKSGGRCVINIGDGKNGAVPTHVDIVQFMKDIGWIPMTTIIWDKNNVSSRTAWGSWLSPSCPSFPTPFEYVLIFAKNTNKLQTKGETDLTKEEFINWSLAKWSFTGENLKKLGHPAAFPIELPKRCIKMLSWIDAVVYDPFMGSGTTALACKMFNRNFIGSEISKEYMELSERRIQEILI
jgi:site-specific DNA-methyltransferase (adenine-specific)